MKALASTNPVAAVELQLSGIHGKVWKCLEFGFPPICIFICYTLYLFYIHRRAHTYLYDSLGLNVRTFHSCYQAFMDVAWGVIRFLQGGITTNWYGLSGPLRLPGVWFPSGSLSLWTFGGPWACGLGLVACAAPSLLGFRFTSIHSSVHPGEQHPPAVDRLARYLHEHQRRRQ
jgi:hypothetical protein